jgi:hypothetical protein
MEGRDLMSAPMAPSLLAAGVSSSQILLKWQPVSGATSYVIDYSANGGSWTQLSSAISGSQSSAVLNCSAGTPYSFMVAADNSYGFSPWSNTYTAITNPAVSQTNTYEPAPTYSASASNVPLFGPSGKPIPTDVQQGFGGDCWFIASLAATAYKAPADIQNMFTYQGTTTVNGATVGLYTVRFFNSSNQARYVTVDTELPVGTLQSYPGAPTNMYYDRDINPMTGSSILWAALAEKAFAEANGLGYVNSQVPKVDSYAAINGGAPSWALEAITGHTATDYPISSNLLSFAAGNIIVLSTKASTVAGLDGGHAYAVIGSTSSTLTVLNPWGTTSQGWVPGWSGTYVGMSNLSLAQIQQNFVQESFGSSAVPVSVDTTEGNGMSEVPTDPAGLQHPRPTPLQHQADDHESKPGKQESRSLDFLATWRNDFNWESMRQPDESAGQLSGSENFTLSLK